MIYISGVLFGMCVVNALISTWERDSFSAMGWATAATLALGDLFRLSAG